MRLSEIVETSAQVAATPGRIAKLALLAETLRRLEPAEVPIGVAYLSGHLRQGRIGLGWAALRSAVERADAPPASPTLFDRPAGATAPLTLAETDAVFGQVASLAGAGAGAARTRALAGLFARAGASERDFLLRLVMGELRQGALAGIMADAVARASGLPLAAIRRAAMLSGDLEAVAVATLAEGETGLARFALALFRPVLPMLAQPAADVDEAMRRFPGGAAAEWKLDGARIQVHRAGREVRVYSRALNDVTAAVPEVVEAVLGLPLADAILDGETIALAADGRPHPFQVTMRRYGRTLDVDRMRGELPLTTFLFDVLRLDGEDIFDRPARERWVRLRERAPALAVPQRLVGTPDAAGAAYDEALAHGHEGILVKSPEAPYEAGARGYAWVKVKAAHTLDLVVLAVEWGNGRRQGWLSNLHLGARDPRTGEFVMLGKTFKGMSDEMLAWQTAEFQRLAVREEGNVVHVRPERVVEIAFNDVQESPRYPGGMALRLARVKAYRPDKSPEEADTVETVRAILRGERASRQRLRH